MSREVSGIEMFVPVKEPPTQRSVDQWAEVLKLNVPRMIEKLREKIPDLKRYLARLVNPAAEGWRNVLSPTFTSRSGADADSIRDKLRANQNRAFAKFETALAHVFEEVNQETGIRFKELVDNKKDLFAEGMADRTLRFTGDKIRGRGIAPMAAMWLAGDSKVLDMLRAGDNIRFGGPVDIAKPGLRPQLKAALVGRLIQSGMAIVYSEMDSTRINKENATINRFLNAMRDETVYEEFTATLTPLKSHCGFFMRDGQLYLQIQVVAL